MGEQPSPPVVGRDAALGELRERVRRAADGSPSVTLVTGETGIGKTRLVGELVAADIATVCAGACLPMAGEPLPFAPLIQALRGLGNTGVLRQQLERSPDLARLLPTWTGADPASEGVVTASSQLGLFQAVLELLEQLGAARPVVYVVEDLHWADRSTLDLLRYLAANLTSERVVVLVTYRADGVEPGSRLATWLAELARLPIVHRLPLERLTPEEATALVRALRRDVDPQTLAATLERSAGNPLFVEQLLLQDSPDAALPDTLHGLLLSRVTALPEHTRTALAAAAVLGRPAAVPLLAQTLDMTPADVEAQLRPALAQHVLEIRADDTVGFAHPAFGEVVYADLMPTARTSLHRRAAELLAQDPSGQPGDPRSAGELARHWLGAGDRRRALDASVAAGEAAEGMYAFGDALAAYTRAAELHGELGGSDHDLSVLLARAAQAAHLVGDSDDAVRLAEEALESTENRDERLGLCERLGSYHFIAGHGEQARGWFERALELLPTGPATARVAKVYAGLALLAAGWSRLQEADEWCGRGLAAAQEAGARREEGLVRNALGSVAGMRGDFGEAVAQLRGALGIAQGVGAADDLALAYVNLSHVLGLAGQLDEVAETGREAGVELTRMGMARQLGSLLKANACEALVDSGRTLEASALVADALAHEPRGIMAAPVLLQAGRLATLTGDLEIAWDRCEQARLVVEAEGAPDAWMRTVLEALAEVELWAERPEAAHDLVVDGLDMIRDTDEAVAGGLLVALGMRALADQAERHRDTASLHRITAHRALLEAAAVVARGSGLPHQGALGRWQEAEAARLDRTATPLLWADLAAAWTTLGRPVSAAYARWREAETRLDSGADSAAIDALRAAHLASLELRARGLQHELERLARWHRIDLLASPSAPSMPAEETDAALAAYGLTERELEVLGELAAGRTNREIAGDLFISSKTASVHVSNILRKLDVSGRQEAARVAHRLGVRSR